MALPYSVRRLFSVPISWEAFVGQAADGEKSYSTAKIVMARVDPAGSIPEMFADGMPRRAIFLLPQAIDGTTIRVTAADRITLPPGQAEPLVPPIKFVNPFYDSGNTLSHYEVFA